MDHDSTKKWLLDTEDPLGDMKLRAIKRMAEKFKKLTKDELVIVQKFAEGMPEKSMIFSQNGHHEISPRWLFSMANEIRQWRYGLTNDNKLRATTGQLISMLDTSVSIGDMASTILRIKKLLKDG